MSILPGMYYKKNGSYLFAYFIYTYFLKQGGL